MKAFKTLPLTLLSTLIVVVTPLASIASDQTGEVLLDPTQPNWFGLKKKKSNANRLVLNSLVMSPERRIAVINGELMREGDTKRGITVQQILNDRVLITTKTGQQRALKLNNASRPMTNKKSRDTNSEKGKTR